LNESSRAPAAELPYSIHGVTNQHQNPTFLNANVQLQNMPQQAYYGLQRESSNFSEPQIIDNHNQSDGAYSTFNCKQGIAEVPMLLDQNAGPITFPHNSLMSSGEIIVKESNLNVQQLKSEFN